MSGLGAALDGEATRTFREVLRELVRQLCARLGLAQRAVAWGLEIAESTLRSWYRKGQRVLRRGRPPQLADRLTRNDILYVIRATAGRITVRELKQHYPHVGRAQLQDLLRRYRKALRKAAKRRLATLSWLQPGSVWAMDFTEFAGGIEELGEDVLVSRDLSSGNVLESAPCAGQGGRDVCDRLAALFAKLGPPLVLKMDNGSGFIDRRTKKLLADNNVLPLYSPPGTPSYNGACEAGVGSVKHRAQDLAAVREAGAPVTIDELEAARQQANTRPVERRAGAPSRAQVWAGRNAVCPAQRSILRHRVEVWRERMRRERGIAAADPLPHAVHASIDRFAIGQALRELNLLLIRRR